MTDLRQAALMALEALHSEKFNKAVTILRTALEQPEQEPVKLHEAVISAWGVREVYFDEDGEPSMHRSPPQRPWVGLTVEEMSDIVADMDVDFGDLLWKVVCLTKIIEATLKERNT